MPAAANTARNPTLFKGAERATGRIAHRLLGVHSVELYAPLGKALQIWGDGIGSIRGEFRAEVIGHDEQHAGFGRTRGRGYRKGGRGKNSRKDGEGKGPEEKGFGVDYAGRVPSHIGEGNPEERGTSEIPGGNSWSATVLHTLFSVAPEGGERIWS